MGYSLTDSSVDIVLLKNLEKVENAYSSQTLTWFQAASHLTPSGLIIQKFEAFSPIPFFLGVQDQEAYHPPPPIIRLLLRDFLMQLFKLFFKIQMKGVLSSRHVRYQGVGGLPPPAKKSTFSDKMYKIFSMPWIIFCYNHFSVM